MVDANTQSMLDLESAKDRLKKSLTALESTVEQKIKDVSDSPGHATESQIQQKLDRAEQDLTKLTEFKQQLEEKLKRTEHDRQHLQEKNQQVKQKVDHLIRQVEQAIIKQQDTISLRHDGGNENSIDERHQHAHR